ncbi:MAG: SDR family oxidoreductase [Deltaproteobacteria bacterium]|nr:SDR family oxidoreductase [Deltaproteobacteria bacterium]MBW2360638.1 SDR family oxidoreductase [Deltaproteobacteria bacterium]
MSMQFDLSGRRILVVGASSGVGLETGRIASAAGARVAFAARREDRVREAAAAAPGEAIGLRCDVCDADACRGAIEAALEAFGGLDALVYATGMAPLTLLTDATQEQWRNVFDTNVIGASLVTAAALPALQASHGRAVYISSYSVRQPLPALGLYRVSKVALDGLIESWRIEHPDVDFTRAILGNTMDTEFAQNWSEEETAEAARVWVERNLFPAANLMPVRAAAEALVAVLATEGYVDDIAIMPRTRDGSPFAEHESLKTG